MLTEFRDRAQRGADEGARCYEQAEARAISSVPGKAALPSRAFYNGLGHLPFNVVVRAYVCRYVHGLCRCFVVLAQLLPFANVEFGFAALIIRFSSLFYFGEINRFRAIPGLQV